MNQDFMRESGFYERPASDIAIRAVEGGLSGHYEPNQPGATSLRDARALWIDGEHVTAEVHERKITIFIGCKILFAGELPEEITERGQVNPWVAATALAGSPVKVGVEQPTEVDVALVWEADKIADSAEGLYEEACQPVEGLRIETSRSQPPTHFIRDFVSQAVIVMTSSLDLAELIVNMITHNKIPVTDLLERGCEDDLEVELVKCLQYAQRITPEFKIQVSGWDLENLRRVEISGR